MSPHLRADPIRDRLDPTLPGSGREPAPRDADRDEREVTVLLVGLGIGPDPADPSDADPARDLLPLYTRSIERQVLRHGGTLVASGRDDDGVMAIFVALERGEAKERAAVAAARAIVHEVRRFERPAGRRLPLGMGIATGPTRVGRIRRGGRSGLSAAGETPSLASRLRRLSHELCTPVVVDATTRRRAGAQAGDFLCRAGAPIGGPDRTSEVWLLPHAGGGDSDARTR